MKGKIEILFDPDYKYKKKQDLFKKQKKPKHNYIKIGEITSGKDFGKLELYDLKERF